MVRLIDADVLNLEYEVEMADDWKTAHEIANVVKYAPTVDAVPVRHGKWIRQTDTRFGEMLNDILICSECNIAFPTVNMIRRSYCPNCGARMDEE